MFNGYTGNANAMRQQGGRMDINQFIQQAAQAKNRGVDPNVIMQNMMQRTPQIRILQQRLVNMAQGRSPAEFITQLAKQNGATEQNAQLLAQMFR